MDTSKEYIDMCREAEEIQKGWESKVGDFYVANNRVFVVENPVIATATTERKKGGECGWAKLLRADGNIVWLPRQDQLQAMLCPCKNQARTLELINDFSESVQGYAKEKRYKKSMEEMWLRYVMSRKYQMSWEDAATLWLPFIKTEDR